MSEAGVAGGEQLEGDEESEGVRVLDAVLVGEEVPESVKMNLENFLGIYLKNCGKNGASHCTTFRVDFLQVLPLIVLLSRRLERGFRRSQRLP